MIRAFLFDQLSPRPKFAWCLLAPLQTHVHLEKAPLNHDILPQLQSAPSLPCYLCSIVPSTCLWPCFASLLAFRFAHQMTVLLCSERCRSLQPCCTSCTRVIHVCCTCKSQLFFLTNFCFHPSQAWRLFTPFHRPTCTLTQSLVSITTLIASSSHHHPNDAIRTALSLLLASGSASLLCSPFASPVKRQSCRACNRAKRGAHVLGGILDRSDLTQHPFSNFIFDQLSPRPKLQAWCVSSPLCRLMCTLKSPLHLETL